MEEDCASGEICIEGRCTSEQVPDASTSMMGDSGPAMPDAGPSCTEPACNLCSERHPDVLVCESFDQDLSLWFPFLVDGGTAELSTGRYHRGGQSLRAVAPAGGGHATYRQGLTPTIETGELYVRAEIYIPSGPDIVSRSPLVLVRQRSTGIRMSIDFGVGNRIQAVFSDAMFVGTAPDTLTRDRWTCVEIHARFADGDEEGLFDLRVDGTLVDATRGTEIRPPDGGFDDLRVGAVTFDKSEIDVEAFVDELVVSREGPIGCED